MNQLIKSATAKVSSVKTGISNSINAFDTDTHDQEQHSNMSDKAAELDGVSKGLLIRLAQKMDAMDKPTRI